MILKIVHYYHTIRYLRIRQVTARLSLFAKRNLLRGYYRKRINRLLPAERPLTFALQQKPVVKSDCKIEEREFTFLNKTLRFTKGIDWHSPGAGKLWLYNLHYQDYLLNMAPSAKNIFAAKEIIQDWIAKNPTGKGNGWEPYPLSLRIVNWLFFFQYYQNYFAEDASFSQQFVNSLYRQSAYLSRFLEFHLLANHLWANIKALIFASVFFNEKRWLKKSLPLFKTQLNEQIHSDGGHFEKSPMYHSIILGDLLDIINLLQAVPSQEYAASFDLDRLKAKAIKMLRWLQALTHPDGRIALFGDSAFAIAPGLAQLKNYYGRLTGKKFKEASGKLQTFPQSGYFVFKGGGHYLVIDGGELGPSYQPGHAHCDLLSYEYSYKGLRFIVDSGVGEYLPSELRQKARSIYSHNTLALKGMEQAEIWQAFRMGRRVKPAFSGFEKKGLVFKGAYENHLNKALSYRHQRTIEWLDEKYFKISDTVSASEISKMEEIIHPHPACRFEMQPGKIALSREGQTVWIVFESTITVRIEDWFYVPEFGRVQKAKMFILQPPAGVGDISYKIMPSE